MCQEAIITVVEGPIVLQSGHQGLDPGLGQLDLVQTHTEATRMIPGIVMMILHTAVPQGVTAAVVRAIATIGTDPRPDTIGVTATAADRALAGHLADPTHTREATQDLSPALIPGAANLAALMADRK